MKEKDSMINYPTGLDLSNIFIQMILDGKDEEEILDAVKFALDDAKEQTEYARIESLRDSFKTFIIDLMLYFDEEPSDDDVEHLVDYGLEKIEMVKSTSAKLRNLKESPAIFNFSKSMNDILNKIKS